MNFKRFHTLRFNQESYKNLHLKLKRENKNYILLISPNYSQAEINEIHTNVFQNINGTLIGAVADIGHKGWSLTSCEGTPFYSNQGRFTKQKAVGRWPSFFKNDSDIEPSFYRDSIIINDAIVPLELKKVSKPKVILTFSDSEPFDLYQWLALEHSSAVKIGCIAARTPFINGKPHTLFYNDKIVFNGSVGMAFENLTGELEIDSTILEPVGEALKISKAKGNIIVEIKETAASKLLMSLTNHFRDLFQDNRLFVKITQDEKFAIFPVSGGDLVKGSLAIETTMDLKPGMALQFMQYTKNMTQNIPFQPDSLIQMGTFSQDRKVNFRGIDTNSICSYSEQGILYGSNNILNGYQLNNIPGTFISLK